MKVVAIKPAFFNGRRVRLGDELDVPEGLKASWFVASASHEAKEAKAKPAKQEPKALSELGGAKAKSFVDVTSGKQELA